MGWERPLPRVKHGAPLVRRPRAERGDRKGGSLPSQNQRLDCPKGASEATGNHSEENGMRGDGSVTWQCREPLHGGTVSV